MTINIPESVMDGISKWMKRGRWPEHLEVVSDEHIHAYCDLHDLDNFDELAEKIGQHRVNALFDMVLMDFLSRETEDGNIVAQFLRRRGWKEKAITKAYLEGIRCSVMSIYEVSDIRPGESFLARDLIRGRDPILVEERLATKNMVQWERFAMRIVEVNGHNIIAGSLLPYNPLLVEQVTDNVSRCAVESESMVEELFEGNDNYHEISIKEMALYMALVAAAPLFSEEWLVGSVLDSADMNLRWNRSRKCRS